ncbi:Ent-copalyl diphosphate synthase protein [Dioscorea alata]|uniref:Ent-copalyl diphosphate synthase protein n=1 Tax=Dioscorea alata TaxID=55571 RepID=A0ACB7UY47_DIOAL|nr:Ent-copalyl diphosphate synthase protein [Dioscorea alata]
MPITEWQDKKLPELREEDPSLEVFEGERIREMINEVKVMLSLMGDGEISISAYDTAWVALVQDINGSGAPQFPSSLRWVVENQLSDGSWGDQCIFSAHDRLISTLACVIALKSWSICSDQCEQGLKFIRENMWRLAEEDEEHMPIGFEVAFPSMVEIAKALGLDVICDDAALQSVYAMRNLKLKRIPRDVMHRVPTTLLHSLEGMPGLDWSWLLHLQSKDGSFLFSPSSTAYALMQTGDKKCLAYLQKAVDKFNGGVPNVYPVDLFEHLWAVDRLERLGISRYLEQEIKDCMDYIYRHWTKHGICWARDSSLQDVDDTSMGFRLLRLHGYDVSPDVFCNFEKDGEFFCFAGQSNQAITGLYNLNRASQIAFPGEEILRRAKSYSYKFLREKQHCGQLLDKWIITKDLPGEVEYALDFPWYSSLPRVETRLYLEQYGGGGDVWIGKTLYRMPFVNNDVYLELAKSDFNQCQAVHQLEWLGLQRWYTECQLAEKGVSHETLLTTYFLAAASVYEPERAPERLGWAKTAVLATAVSSFFSGDSCSKNMRQDFIQEFINYPNSQTSSRGKMLGEWDGGLLIAINQLLDHIISDNHSQQQQQKMCNHLRHAWEDWMRRWRKDGEEEDEKEHVRGGLSEGRNETGMLLVRTIEMCAGRCCLDEHVECGRLAQQMSSICHHLQHATLLISEDETRSSTERAVESEMQELVRLVLQKSSDGLEKKTKQTFLSVAKSFYYAAHCPPTTLSRHIAMVLFQKIV